MKPRFIHCDYPFESSATQIRIQKVHCKRHSLPLLGLSEDMGNVLGCPFLEGKLLVKDLVHCAIRCGQEVAQVMDFDVPISLDSLPADFNVASVPCAAGPSTSGQVTNLQSACSILFLQLVDSRLAVSLVLKNCFQLVKRHAGSVPLPHAEPDANALDYPQRNFH